MVELGWRGGEAELARKSARAVEGICWLSRCCRLLDEASRGVSASADNPMDDGGAGPRAVCRRGLLVRGP